MFQKEGQEGSDVQRSCWSRLCSLMGTVILLEYSAHVCVHVCVCSTVWSKETGQFWVREVGKAQVSEGLG